MEWSPQTLVNRAQDTGLPVVWFRYGSTDVYKVIIEGHVFRLDNEAEAFFHYFSAFSIFAIQWDSVMENNIKKQRGFPNRGALEFIHW